MIKVGIIRHGSTLWNAEGRAQGNSHILLDEKGIIGAKKNCRTVKKKKPGI